MDLECQMLNAAYHLADCSPRVPDQSHSLVAAMSCDARSSPEQAAARRVDHAIIQAAHVFWIVGIRRTRSRRQSAFHISATNPRRSIDSGCPLTTAFRPRHLHS